MSQAKTLTKKQARRKEAREELKALSKAAKMLVKEGAFDSVNHAIEEIYKDNNPDVLEFRTFKQWKDAGFRVKKGEKGFPIWGKPREIAKDEETGEQVEGTEMTESEKKERFFPVAYLFADTQVEKIEE